jgi:hypothetical protein
MLSLLGSIVNRSGETAAEAWAKDGGESANVALRCYVGRNPIAAH